VRTVRILEDASQEAIEAAAWYEYEQPGLGAEFFAAVDAAIDVIEENFLPLSPLPEETGNTGARRLILERFPYDIVAIELPDETVVIAVAHHSRKPGYWLGRSKPPGS
jgi:toxin ParE1/3/4|tara:strand:+ start:1742 stop:2065 length:324 start_codon:yes stop_codon:yes gene_type:complete